MNENLKCRIKSLLEKLKNDKKAVIIIVCGVAGMLLIMLSGSTSTSDTKIPSAENSSTIFFDESEMLNQLTQLIESISGAGEARIMITYECGEETVYATDTDESTDENEIQIKSEYIIIEDDSGETGLRIKTVFPKVMGVAIICQGGDNPIVREKIYSVISALFNLSTNKISVASMA